MCEIKKWINGVDEHCWCLDHVWSQLKELLTILSREFLLLYLVTERENKHDFCCKIFLSFRLDCTLRWMSSASKTCLYLKTRKNSSYCAHFPLVYFSLWSPFKMAMNGWIHYNSGCTRTVSSSFSIPVGISSTARLTAAKSINSGISSSLYTAMGLLASIARARNDSLLILVYLRRRMDAPAVKRWQKYTKCPSKTHISFHQYIFDDALSGYLPRNENYAVGRSSDSRFAATCNVSFSSIMADRVTINISQRAVQCASCRRRTCTASSQSLVSDNLIQSSF